MAPKKGEKCVNCGERSEDGIYDAIARFWCEDCVIFILADRKPKHERP